MSYQTKIEICVKSVGYSLAVAAGLGLDFIASALHNPLLTVATYLVGVVVAWQVISFIMNWLRETAGV